MYDRLIDILAAAANKTTGTVYVTLNPATQNWCISNLPTEHSAKLDRNNLKHSIACEVTKLGALLPQVECYNN